MDKKYDGVIEMRFLPRNGRTIAQKLYHKGNSRISSVIPTTENQLPYYFLISTGGGFTEGEQYQVKITLEDDAHAVLTTQTPNYVYKCDNLRQTCQETQIKLGKGAFLEYYMDEVIPYKNAYYRQFMDLDLAEDASLILTDGLTSGWSPDEKPFQYRDVGMRTRIKVAGKLVYNDYLLCTPQVDELAELGYFEGYTNFNSVVLIDKNIDQDFVKKAREVIELPEADVSFGISLLEENGAVLRILGYDGYTNRQIQNQFIEFYREEFKGCAPLKLRKNDRAYN